jgi:hypothetical protein
MSKGVKGKPWGVEEENELIALVENSIEDIAAEFDKT